MEPVRTQWWDNVVSSDIAPYYASRELKGKRGSLIWGDRVRVLERDDEEGVARISARGADSPWRPMWVRTSDLDGEALLEVYVIDVGQGDGLLVVTPEGHHLVVDGGNIRSKQNGGKNAADFIDWKFTRDYLSYDERYKDEDDDGVNDIEVDIELDAVIASHCDIDHFGGLSDLLDLDDPKNAAELYAKNVRVDSIYHAGLSWWMKRKSSGKWTRTLGPTTDRHYTKLLGGRTSALAATKNIDTPDEDTLSGSWGKFIRAATRAKKASSPSSHSKIVRLSSQTHSHLPGFDTDDTSSDVSIRVLGPIEGSADGEPGLAKFPDGDSKNTNGHSVVLRLDYGERRLLLTGDLNTHSQNLIMETYGCDFLKEFRSDMAKGCHHGSHDVSYKFLDGLRPVATVISSGDAETHDHPRPTIVSASALTGRRLIEGDSLVAPLVYMTEVARSVSITKIHNMAEYKDSRPKYESKRPKGAEKIHNTESEMSKYRLFLKSSPKSPFDWPRLDTAQVVQSLRYGLVNVRTDGKRLFFAQREESGNDWSYQTLSCQQIEAAR